MRLSTITRGAFSLALVILVLALGYRPVRADNFIMINSGFTATTGDVNDLLVGSGATVSGRFFAGINEQVYVGGGLGLSFFGGQSDAAGDITDSAFSLTLEAGTLLYLVNKLDSTVRPFVAVNVGFGGLGWDYSGEAIPLFGTDDDSIAFIFVAPEIGVDIGVAETASLIFTGRFLASQYSDDTEKNAIWDLDGGHFWQIEGGIAFEF